MSLVVAIKTKDKIYLGADTLWHAGDMKGETSKIWRVSADLLVGSSGTVREAQIVKYNSDVLFTEKATKKYLVNNFKRNLFSIVEEIDRQDKTEQSSYYLVCTKTDVYSIWTDGTVFELNDSKQDFLTIGSGAFHADAVLRNNVGKHPKERIKEAIETASNFIVSVNSEIEYLEI